LTESYEVIDAGNEMLKMFPGANVPFIEGVGGVGSSFKFDSDTEALGVVVLAGLETGVGSVALPELEGTVPV
jgi:hypothetical protein